MNYFIAHRGIHNKNIKENSLESFECALKNNLWDGFECDVRTSKDNIFLICHNPFAGKNIVSKTKYSKLKKSYNLVNLESVLSLESDKLFLLEIKESTLDIEKFVNFIEKYKNKRIYVMSFHKNVIHKLKERSISCKLGVLNYVLNSEEDYSCYDFICLLETVASKKLVSYFQDRGIEVFLYGVKNIKKSNLKYHNIYIISDKNVL